MGVQWTVYLIYGAHLPKDAFDWDKHEDLACGGADAEFALIDDYMCGNYLLAGKVLAQCDRDNEGQGIAPLTITPDEIATLVKDVNRRMELNLSAGDFSLMLFTHMS